MNSRNYFLPNIDTEFPRLLCLFFEKNKFKENNDLKVSQKCSKTY